MTSTTTTTTEKMQLLTRNEVNQNNGNGKTLVLLHDKVYDVTKFLNEHPGGEEVLLEHGGKDASEDFDDVGHSQDAHELMKKYLIGELVDHEKSNKTPKKGWMASYGNKGDKNMKNNPDLMVYMLVGGLATALLAAYVFLF